MDLISSFLLKKEPALKNSLGINVINRTNSSFQSGKKKKQAVESKDVTKNIKSKEPFCCIYKTHATGRRISLTTSAQLPDNDCPQKFRRSFLIQYCFTGTNNWIEKSAGKQSEEKEEKKKRQE